MPGTPVFPRAEAMRATSGSLTSMSPTRTPRIFRRQPVRALGLRPLVLAAPAHRRLIPRYNQHAWSVHNRAAPAALKMLKAQPWVYDTSIVPEAFMDTMMVNGHPYPYLDVQPQAYRFRVLNACNDRNISLSLFVADTGGPTSGPNTVVNATATATVANGMVTGFTGLPGGSNYTSAPNVYMYGGGGRDAAAVATLTPTTVASLTVVNGGSGYTTDPTVAIIGGGGSGATATATVTPMAWLLALPFTPARVIPRRRWSKSPETAGSGAVATAALTPTSVAAINGN